jgi:ergothioneine biosynthesis protein EgtB
VLDLGLAHEEQHQELLLTDILHAFSEHPLRPRVRPEAPALVAETPGPQRFLSFPGGLHEVGSAGEGFAFDNEGPRHPVYVAPFALAARPVSVGELRAFINAGGYRDPRWWLSEGWQQVQQGGREAPHNVSLRDGGMWVFGVDGEREARDDEPAAHLTLYEADALARFLGGRLPTEFEWEVASRHAAQTGVNDRERGALRPLPAPASGDAPAQMFGDVWEWTASAYGAYPGFRAGRGRHRGVQREVHGEPDSCCAAGRASPRAGTCGPPTETSGPRPRRFQMTGARVAKDLPR